MPGPAPKPSGTRQRRNRAATQAELPPAEVTASNPVPALHERDDLKPWHPKVVEWWDSVWRSPMAAEFCDADRRGGLSLLADLYQLRWTSLSPTGILEVAAEIRLQERRYGLDAMARRALQWEIVRPNSAGAAPTKPSGAAPKRSSVKDPRKALRIV